MLTLDAPEIRVNSQAAISSFGSKVPSGAPGMQGDDGGTLVTRSDKITGGDLRIDLSGKDGLPGSDGIPGAAVPAGSKAKGRGLQGITGCGGGRDATPGGQGRPGGDDTPVEMPVMVALSSFK